MNRTHALQLIRAFEHARNRPGMYFPVNQSGIRGFLGGIHILRQSLLGEESMPGLTEVILAERGWDATNAFGPWPEMEARGYTIEEMIAEVLTIEIMVLQRAYRVSLPSED